MFTNKKSFWLVSKEGCTRSRTELSPRLCTVPGRVPSRAPVSDPHGSPPAAPPEKQAPKAAPEGGPGPACGPSASLAPGSGLGRPRGTHGAADVPRPIRSPRRGGETRGSEVRASKDEGAAIAREAAAPPTLGAGAAPRLGGDQTMREVGRGGRRGPRDPGGGRSAAAHSSPPARPLARAPSPSPSPSPRPCSPPPPEPNSSRRGRAPRSGPTPSSNHKTSPQLQQLKLRSHRAAPGAPPRTESGQLGTFAAERNNGRPLPRRTAGGCSGGGEERERRSRRRLSAAAGSALALRTARARRRMRYRALLEGRATPGGRGGLRGEPRAESWDCLARLSVKLHGTNRKTPGRCAQVAKGS